MVEQPIHVALVYDYGPGGVITFTRTIHRILRDRGHAPVLVELREFAMNRHQDVGLIADAQLHYSRYGNKHRLRKEFLALISDVDVVITSSYLPVVWRAREDTDIPHIQIVHQSDATVYEQFIRLRSCYDLCIAVNRNVASHITQIMKDPAVARYVRNPYLPEGEMASSPIVRKERSSLLKVLFVGRIEREKGADILGQVARLSYAENLPFVFDAVGPIRDRKLAERLDEMPNVRVRGSIPPTGMRDEYHTADVFMLLSRSEAMPYALLEALDADCYVIAMNPDHEPAILLQSDESCTVGQICRDTDEVMHSLRVLAQRAPSVEDGQPGQLAVQRYIDNGKTIAHYERIMLEVMAAAKGVQRPSFIQYPNRLDYPWMPELPLRLLRTLIHGTPLFRWLKQTAP